MNTSIILLLAILACFSFNIGNSSTNNEKKFLGEVIEKTGVFTGEEIKTLFENPFNLETKLEEVSNNVVHEGAEALSYEKGFLSKY